MLLGECKDRGGKKDGGKDPGTIDKKDIDNLRRVADALPRKRFDAFMVLARLCPFSADEIALAKTLNDEYRRRVILLTARELEPYHFYDRTKLEYKNIKEYASTAEELANNTAQMYFTKAGLQQTREVWAYFHWIKRGRPLWEAHIDWAIAEQEFPA